MRAITAHNDPALTITALDAPDAEGVCSMYLLTWSEQRPNDGHSLCLDFRGGPTHHDGLTDTALLAVLRDRLEARQRGPEASADGATALTCVTWALEALAGEKGTQEKEHTA